MWEDLTKKLEQMHFSGYRDLHQRSKERRVALAWDVMQQIGGGGEEDARALGRDMMGADNRTTEKIKEKYEKLPNDTTASNLKQKRDLLELLPCAVSEAKELGFACSRKIFEKSQGQVVDERRGGKRRAFSEGVIEECWKKRCNSDGDKL